MLDWQEQINPPEATWILSGKITFENSGELRTRVKEVVLNHPIRKLTFNMGNIRFIDSSGLGLLVSIKNTMVKRDGVFVIRNVTETVRNIMNQTGLDRYFDI